MAWRIEFEEAAKKELSQLDRSTQSRIIKYLRERIAPSESPRDFGEALRGNLSGLWKYRVGEYRLVVEIQDEEICVLVVRVGHRRKEYRGH
ncbi:type II toxin-antitoxin system RelE family toxin [Desulfovibrio inopinatus]|uniref:type II toxin-antitoxin system RelE family toxin n=1 Tax=Desulfovibrio inopinatus TaxID=102109 RepID=UPI0004838DC9|nr:type II toxin-antitoxin system RelE/ParE family toxin [Desulfovibrio inopinatus]